MTWKVSFKRMSKIIYDMTFPKVDVGNQDYRHPNKLCLYNIKDDTFLTFLVGFPFECFSIPVLILTYLIVNNRLGLYFSSFFAT